MSPAREPLRPSEPAGACPETGPELLERAGIGTLLLSPSGQILETNQAMRDLLGGEATGKPLWTQLNPEVRATLREALQTLRDGTLETGRLEGRLRREGGEEAWVLLTLIPQRDSQGTIQVINGLVEDFTEQHRAEAAYEGVLRRNELLLTAAGEGIFGLDLQGHTTFVNPAAARMVGYTAEELVGKPMHELIHHTRSDGRPYPWRECPTCATMRDGVSRQVADEVFWRRDGTPFPVEYHNTVLRERGTIMGAVLTFRDITERKQAEAELARRNQDLSRANAELLEVDRYKNNFLSIVSHELRTPLNFITGFASILEDEVVGPLNPQQHAYVAKILSGADRLLHMVNDLLDMNRMLAGRFTLDPQPVDYRALVAEVVEAHQSLARAKQVTLEASVEVSQPVWIDPLRIAQVLRHLVDNAVKFTGAGGRVRVRALVEPGEAEDRLVTQVTDTGSGIASEDLPKLFVTFKQLNMSATREAGGMGLGLSLSKGIVEAHGGELGVLSERGRGSTFWFTLPIGASDELGG